MASKQQLPTDNDLRAGPFVDLITELLGGERIIAVRPILIDLTGSADAAAMLSQAIYWTKRTRDPKGWFYKTETEWRSELRISTGKQRRARKRLRACGRFWFEKRVGLPRQLYFRVDVEALYERLRQLVRNDPTSGTDSNLTVLSKRSHRRGQSEPSSECETNQHLPEITPETSLKSTRRGGGGHRSPTGSHKKTAAAAYLPLFDEPTRQSSGISPIALARSAFTEIGFDEPFGQPDFQAIWVTHYSEYVAAKNSGDTEAYLQRAMERALQECQRFHIGVPKKFYDAKHDVEKVEDAEFRQRNRRTPL